MTLANRVNQIRCRPEAGGQVEPEAADEHGRAELREHDRDCAADAATGRDREVLTLMAQGLSNDEISARLHLSVATVKTHVGSVLAKTGSRDRTQAVVTAYRAGMVTVS